MERTNFYILNFAYQSSITANSTPSSEVQIGNEYDFEITDVRAIINGATDVTGGLLLNLVLSGGVNLNENPVDMFAFGAVSGAIGDTSAQPIKVPWAGCIIPSNTKVTAKWTNSSGQTLSFQLLLVGRKIFK